MRTTESRERVKTNDKDKSEEWLIKRRRMRKYEGGVKDDYWKKERMR